MTLDTLITEYIAGLSGIYFIRQCMVIIAVFAFGAVLCDLFCSKTGISAIKRVLLCFPVGLSAFSITAYVLLIAGIPYSVWTVCIAALLEITAAVYLNRRAFSRLTPAIGKHMLIAVCAVAATALVASSGAAPVSISNDTMYYFKRYPDAIVFYRGLRDQFDFFLTDTGLGSVCIDTLPALFGFGDSFGIREFFHINFLVFFGSCAYDTAKRYMSPREAAVSACLVTVLLAVSTPFMILSHWALANMYFMELFFISAYAALDNEHTGIATCAVMMTALALLRMEGTLFVVWLVICISLYTGINRELAAYVTIPVSVLFGCYCIRIYTLYNLSDNIYTFLTPVKAVLLVGLLIACSLYLLFIFPKLMSRLGAKLQYLYIIMLILGNMVLFIRNRSLYIGNLQAFYANLFRQSGWGMLPYFVITATVLLAALHILYKQKSRPSDSSEQFIITMVVGYIFIVLAASYGRGDVLLEDVGDSGNRVLLQIVPLLIMMYGQLFMKFYGKKD